MKVDVVPDPTAHPHAGFVELQVQHARAVANKRDLGPLIEHMAAYVDAFSTDDRFRVEWARLAKWAREKGLQESGLSMQSERTLWRIRQFNAIMKAAHWYHLNEVGSPATGAHVDETMKRLEVQKSG